MNYIDIGWINYLPLCAAAATLLVGIATIGMVGRRAKQQAAIDMFKEFNSLEFSIIRIQANFFLRTHPAINLVQLHRGGNDEKLEQGATHVWAIARFFQRMYVTVDRGFANQKLVSELLGAHYVWWYEYKLRDALRDSKWKLKRDLEDGIEWLKRIEGEQKIAQWFCDAKEDIKHTEPTMEKNRI